MTLSDDQRLALATKVAAQLSLESAIEHAHTAVVDNAPHFSDDGLDYMAAAANVYVELVTIYRTDADRMPDYIAWLAQDPYETWGATDGDMRWWLADYLDADLAAEWTELVDHIFD